jgi:hypothetical protein
MVGKIRSGKRQCTLKCAFKPQNKNFPKDGMSNRNTSSCLLETINIVPYLSSGIVLQPSHQYCTSIEWHDHSKLQHEISWLVSQYALFFN